jgi:hypothetical protein
LDEMEEKKDFVDADVRKCSTTETELEIDVKS